MKTLTIIALLFMTSGCWTQTAKTAIDVARIACEQAFGADELPQGMTLEDVCEAQEDLQPYLRHLLAAKQAVGAAHGITPPKEDENTDD